MEGDTVRFCIPISPDFTIEDVIVCACREHALDPEKCFVAPSHEKDKVIDIGTCVSSLQEYVEYTVFGRFSAKV